MLTRGKSVFTPVFSSRLAPAFTRYVDLKRSLGRRFDIPSRTLQSLDRFLHDHRTKYPDLNAAAFEAWCHTHEHVSSGVRRVRMLEVSSFCLYRRRTEPQCFVPDPSSFPAYHQRVQPYIFSEAEVAKLLRAATGLPRYPASPLRPEVIRLAIALLFTTGIRRGELLGLTLGDYNRQELTLHIRETKFYKSRLLPINGSIADEMDRCLRARTQRKVPVSPDSALIWNAAWGGGAYSGTALRHALQPLLQKCGIVTPKGKLPRIHDFRHGFAVNTLLRWYRAGVDVDAKLPLLATYLGHGSAVSTHYYLHFIEPLRTAASERFANRYGELVSPLPKAARRRG
jgi:integrase/recombinase XerD